MEILHLKNSNFDTEVNQSQKPVLVDFWAEWCSPCKRIAPVIDELAKEYKEKAKIAKVNIDESPDIATKFGIMSIPTILLFKDGKIVKQVVGAVSKSELKSMIDSNI